MKRKRKKPTAVCLICSGDGFSKIKNHKGRKKSVIHKSRNINTMKGTVFNTYYCDCISGRKLLHRDKLRDEFRKKLDKVQINLKASSQSGNRKMSKLLLMKFRIKASADKQKTIRRSKFTPKCLKCKGAYTSCKSCLRGRRYWYMYNNAKYTDPF